MNGSQGSFGQIPQEDQPLDASELKKSQKFPMMNQHQESRISHLNRGIFKECLSELK
jgi:hypothetical protein